MPPPSKAIQRGHRELQRIDLGTSMPRATHPAEMLMVVLDLFAPAENPYGSLLYCWLADILQVAVGQTTQPTSMSQSQRSPARDVVVIDHAQLILTQPLFSTCMNRFGFKPECTPSAPFLAASEERLFPFLTDVWHYFVRCDIHQSVFFIQAGLVSEEGRQLEDDGQQVWVDTGRAKHSRLWERRVQVSVQCLRFAGTNDLLHTGHTASISSPPA